MLFEDFFTDEWWVEHPWHTAILASAYAAVSLVIAAQVFAGNPGIVSVTFLTLFLLPSIMLIRERGVNDRYSSSLERFIGPLHISKAYTAYFTGTFFTYLGVAFTLPFFGFNVTRIVKEQLLLLPGLTGGATFSIGKFAGIFANNWFVLVLVFLFATIWRDGGMFFVLWNASAWGAIFGYRAMGAASAAGVNPWYYLGIELSQVLWHTALEAGAYILAAVAGSIIGRHAYLGKEVPRSFIGGLTALFLATFGAKTLFETLEAPPLVTTGVGIAVFFGAAYLLQNFLVRSPAQFVQGITVFGTGLALFLIGAVVETLVLNNSTSLQTIYRYSSMFISQ